MVKSVAMVRQTPTTPPPYMGHAFVPLPEPSEDNYSSEEELKEIINEQNVKEKSKKTPSKKEKSKSKTDSKCGLKTVASVTAEKRKWSEVISDDDLENDLETDDAGLELEMAMQRSSRLYVRSSGGATTASTASTSSCSNDDPDSGCLCGRRSKLTTPVQFCTSPPMDVHR